MNSFAWLFLFFSFFFFYLVVGGGGGGGAVPFLVMPRRSSITKVKFNAHVAYAKYCMIRLMNERMNTVIN